MVLSSNLQNLQLYSRVVLARLTKLHKLKKPLIKTTQINSTALDLANVDNDDTTQSEATKLKIEVKDAKANLPGDADSPASAVQTLAEQG